MQVGYCALLCCLVAGCGPAAPEIIPIETAPVTGTATYDGKPLENYRVYFFTSEHPAQEPATARIAADGTFSLSVREPDDGAIIGTNKIWFAYDPPVPDQVPGFEKPYDLPPPSVELPQEYLSQDKSPLSVDVPEGGLENYKIQLP
jgi:hypothetical protein